MALYILHQGSSPVFIQDSPFFLSPTKGQLKETQPWKQCGTAFKDVQMEREDTSECSVTDWRASNGEGGSPNIMINRGAQSAATHYSLSAREDEQANTRQIVQTIIYIRIYIKFNICITNKRNN